MRTIFYFFLIAIACSCNSKKQEVSSVQNTQVSTQEEIRKVKLLKRKAEIDSLNKMLDWREIRDGLYVNKNGDIGFIAYEVLDPGKDLGVVYYQTAFCCEPGYYLKSVVDPSTFKHIAGGGFGAYYKDKNHIYHTFGTSDSENFSVVEEADYATFKVIADCYAKDKNHVYDMRDGIREDIDAKTFKVLEIDNRCYAKDKNGYYEGTDKLTDEQLKDPEMQKIIKRLDKL